MATGIETPSELLERRLKELEAENAQLRKAPPASGQITLKVSPKGAISLYGLGRFPVTLYAGQWQRIMTAEMVETFAEFIRTHVNQLSWKDR